MAHGDSQSVFGTPFWSGAGTTDISVTSGTNVTGDLHAIVSVTNVTGDLHVIGTTSTVGGVWQHYGAPTRELKQLWLFNKDILPPAKLFDEFEQWRQ